jgi:hypothetical protein
MLVSNVHAVLPRDWVIQIFYNEDKKMAVQGIIVHMG